MTLVLDDQHRYALDGRPVPGVTEVIRHFVPSRGVGDWYLTRGKAVHMAVQLALDGTLDWRSLDERIAGRVKAILGFVAHAKLSPVAWEIQLAHSLFRYAGTLDFVGRDEQQNLVLCDWKGSVDCGATIQLGGYQLLYPDYITKAAAVECRDNGTFKCHWARNRELKEAGKVFLAMLTIYGWKNKNDLIKQNEPEPEPAQAAD